MISLLYKTLFACQLKEGIENEDTLLQQSDLVYKDDLVSAFINSFWVGKSEGHVIVVPNQHFENMYALPSEYGTRIFEISKKIAIVMKEAYKCDGITIRQNNEPAGDQHAFHYHLHVFPRYEHDEFNKKVTDKKKLAEPEKRITYAKKLVNALSK